MCGHKGRWGGQGDDRRNRRVKARAAEPKQHDANVRALDPRLAGLGLVGLPHLPSLPV